AAIGQVFGGARNVAAGQVFGGARNVAAGQVFGGARNVAPISHPSPVGFRARRTSGAWAPVTRSSPSTPSFSVRLKSRGAKLVRRGGRRMTSAPAAASVAAVRDTSAATPVAPSG